MFSPHLGPSYVSESHDVFSQWMQSASLHIFVTLKSSKDLNLPQIMYLYIQKVATSYTLHGYTPPKRLRKLFMNGRLSFNVVAEFNIS